MSDRTIKPCPFCGQAVKLKCRMGSYGYTLDSVVIGCASCKIEFSEDSEAWERGRGCFCIRQEAEEKLLKRWNTRHDVREEPAVEGSE